MRKIMLVVFFITGIVSVNAQTEREKITETLNNYMDGTANGDPVKVQKAFHEDLNLYFVKNNELQTWNGKKYISNIKPGRKSNRVGKIISIDIENNAAIAKLEIDMPDSKRLFVDYMMLLKVKDEWKIIHKSFTSKSY